MTVFRSAPWRRIMVSPISSSRLGLARWPLTLTLPPLTASLASERVLKKRAAHSHLSMRTFFGLSLESTVVEVVDLRATKNNQAGVSSRH